jgi:hypothetical protein
MFGIAVGIGLGHSFPEQPDIARNVRSEVLHLAAVVQPDQ